MEIKPGGFAIQAVIVVEHRNFATALNWLKSELSQYMIIMVCSSQ